MWRRYVAIALGVMLVVGAIAGGTAWYVLHTRVRTWFWDQIAAQPLTPEERDDFARCRSPAWWGWLRVLETDLQTPCGEAWVATTLADHLGSNDRAVWVENRLASADAPPATKMRIAAALALAGYPPDLEPAWLVEDLDPGRYAEWIRAAAESDPVAAQLGPRIAALALSARVRDGSIQGDDALPVLDWLAQVDDPRAEVDSTLTAVMVAGGYADLVDTVRKRRAAGHPITGMPARWSRTFLHHPECQTEGCAAGPCASRCAGLWSEIADQVLTDDAIEDGIPRSADPVEPADLAEFLTATNQPVDLRRGLAWAVNQTATWVRSSPDPAARLRSFATRPVDPTASLARLVWDGAGPPFLTGLVVQAVGGMADVPVEIRVGDEGDLWFDVGGVQVVRSCGSASAQPPEGPAWPTDSLLSGAIVEYALPLVDKDPVAALRLAVASQRLDPLIGGPLAVRLAGVAPKELEAGRRIGGSLLGPMTLPSGADNARRHAGEHGFAACTP